MLVSCPVGTSANSTSVSFTPFKKLLPCTRVISRQRVRNVTLFNDFCGVTINISEGKHAVVNRVVFKCSETVTQPFANHNECWGNESLGRIITNLNFNRTSDKQCHMIMFMGMTTVRITRQLHCVLTHPDVAHEAQVLIQHFHRPRTQRQEWILGL